jgi:hypothetical protein
MILMYSEKGGYMNVYNAREQKRAETKGFKVWVNPIESPLKPTVKVVKKVVKRRKPRVKK